MTFNHESSLTKTILTSAFVLVFVACAENKNQFCIVINMYLLSRAFRQKTASSFKVFFLKVSAISVIKPTGYRDNIKYLALTQLRKEGRVESVYA